MGPGVGFGPRAQPQAAAAALLSPPRGPDAWRAGGAIQWVSSEVRRGSVEVRMTWGFSCVSTTAAAAPRKPACDRSWVCVMHTGRVGP